MLTGEKGLKILDFGLAKVIRGPGNDADSPDQRP